MLKENLTTLINLQKVDRELQALEELKGDLPQQVRNLKIELDAKQKQFEEKTQLLAETKKSRALLEGELTSHQEKLNKYKEQLYAVTSNREYDAISVEIDTVNEKINETEDQILSLIESEEQLGGEIENIQPEILSLQESLIDREKELAQKIEATDTEYRQYQSKRKELAGKLMHRVLYQYERIRKGIGNSAVAEIQNGSCTGCFSAIPPQKQVEVRTMADLILCESCGRILVSGKAEPVVN